MDLDVVFFNTRFHAGHHGYAKCNFAQNIELWDRLFGTYRDYSKAVEKHKVKKGAELQQQTGEQNKLTSKKVQ